MPIIDLPIHSDKDQGGEMSQVVSQSCMVMMNHRRDLAGDAQMGVPHENHSASELIPAVLPSNQCGVLFDDAGDAIPLMT